MSQEIFISIENSLLNKGYSFERKDLERPWGGFWVIDEKHENSFISEYFPNLNRELFIGGQKISPKILSLKPNKKLSWQYHHRRKEIWKIVDGPVGIVRSETDLEHDMTVYDKGDQVVLEHEERHRLVGLNDWGMIAEIWIHTDPLHPSDEDDIIRIHDDFNRKTPNASMTFLEKLDNLTSQNKELVEKSNKPKKGGNNIFQRWCNPIITPNHIPIYWKYDLNEDTNPHLLQRLGINATFNSGAMLWNGKYILVVRVEGDDRKSFFAIAESPNGVDNFKFWDYPITMPETENPDTNIYDMRLTHHEDGWIYGLFCTERKDMSQPNNTSAATAQCGIARSKDLITWDRLPDLITYSGQQRNVVLHPEFVEGKYALYTRPQDGFISVGGGGGIGWGLSDSMINAEIKDEVIVDSKVYHTIKEIKNGQGPAPIKTDKGWLHLAHGVRNTAAGLRYVLYMFLTDLDQPWKITHSPGGHFIAPEGEERLGDVSNVVFSNGWIKNKKDEVFIYYGSSDTRMHVATSTVDKLLDYVVNTPEDGLRSATSVMTRNELIQKNLKFKNQYGL